MTTLYPEASQASKEIVRDRKRIVVAVAILTILVAIAAVLLFPYRKDTELLHVSYEASREFYAALNQAYYATLPESDRTRVRMNHAGSVRQAHNLAHGQIADIVSLASSYDLQSIAAKHGDSEVDWDSPVPSGSSPFHSTISLVVRAGNPKRLGEWTDLWRPDIKLALPSPKRSGAGRWAFLALEEAARERSPATGNPVLELQELYIRATPLPAGARTALSLFAQQTELDAFLTWESETLRPEVLAAWNLEAIHFARSIRATPSIALLRAHAERRDTLEVAQEYLDFHYSETAQRIAAQHHLRPSHPSIRAAVASQFPASVLYDVDAARWSAAFASDGLLERLESLRTAALGGQE